MERIFREDVPRSEDRDINIQIGRSKDAVIPLVERFEPTLICIDCNLAEGRVKLDLLEEIERNFTFTPTEIATFITPAENRVHEIDINQARVAWISAKEDFASRIDFARRMAKRIAAGRHRREVSPGRRLQRQVDDRDVVYRLFTKAVPPSHRISFFGGIIEARSVSYDSVGHSPKRKRLPRVRPPTDTEFAQVQAAHVGNKTWPLADTAWECPCCNRSKREICRKSNRGLWTARIHRLTEYLAEDNEESLRRRILLEPGQLILGSYRRVLVCQDCRGILSELRQRRAGVSEQSLTIRDLFELVGEATPHTSHEIDFDRALSMVASNGPLLEAIKGFEVHRSRATGIFVEIKRLVHLMEWPWAQAQDYVSYEFAKARGWELAEGDDHVAWLVSEAHRLRELDSMRADHSDS